MQMETGLAIAIVRCLVPGYSGVELEVRLPRPRVTCTSPMSVLTSLQPLHFLTHMSSLGSKVARLLDNLLQTTCSSFERNRR
jgi:hypothetical protein